MPLSDYGDYRDSHQGRGSDYHLRFSKRPHRQFIWEFEKIYLSRILESFIAPQNVRHLDFACGTGRILSFLEPHVKSSVGLDISESMLKEAQRHVSDADLLHGDLLSESILKERRFDLITAFRFFPNAEPQLRKRAIAELVPLLADDGLLVLNNHINSESPTLRLLHQAKKVGDDFGMRHQDIAPIIKDAGLQIYGLLPVGLIPSWEQYLLFPSSLLYWLERLALRIVDNPLWAQNVIYVCGRRGSKNTFKLP